jgi:hypothetical protein
MFWVPKPFISYFEMTLHAAITFRVGSSHKVCLNHLWIISIWTCMHVLHLGFGLHSKTHPNYILGILKRPYMWVLHLRLPFHYRFYLNHLLVILKGTWIGLLRLGLRFHIILQYPHMYLLSPITNLALMF